MSYLIIKAIHIVSIVSWMAGLLYLPRLFVYHSSASLNSTEDSTFKIMERRLLYGIMYPAMIATWISGIILMIKGGWLASTWFELKLLCVVGLTIYHIYLAYFTQAFNKDQRLKPALFFRIINEIPTILMILIILLVVIKPF